MKKPEALPAIISGTSTTECLSVKISTTVVSRSVFLKSAFVSMLHYHCQSRKQIFNAAQSQYVSATVIGGANAQLSESKGGWEGSFGRKFFFQKCGLVGRSVALWGEVWSIHCQGGGRQGRQAWWLWLCWTHCWKIWLPCPPICKYSTLQRLKDHLNSDIAFSRFKESREINIFYLFTWQVLRWPLCCGVWIHIMGEGNIDTL